MNFDFNFRQKVKVKTGFHKNCTGVVVDKKYGGEYLVAFTCDASADCEVHMTIYRKWFPAHFLEKAD